MEGGKLGCAVKREKGDDSNIGQEDCKEAINVPKDDHHKLELARAEIEEVREENQRLKKYLAQIMADYKSLEKRLHDIEDNALIEQQQDHSAAAAAAMKHCTSTVTHNIQERDLVSLSLGRTTTTASSTHDNRWKKDDEGEKQYYYSKNNSNRSVSDDHEQEVVRDERKEEGLTLGLDCKFEVSSNTTATIQAHHDQSPANNVSSGDNSVEEVICKEDAAGETTWPPRKALKNARSNSNGGDNEVAQQNPAKKARVSVRVRCETPTMNDGCQWRKYGQKIAKGNPCPRAYYRCTVSPSCPVRKQVQRCAQDMSILVTTYEGAHNHPLPISATAMASTTSAAVCMLMSGSTVSGSNPNSSSASMAPITSTPPELQGLNFYFSDGSKPNQFYPPNSALISPSPSCPTITLDLTSNAVSNSSSSPFNRSSMPSANFLPRYSSANLNFSSWNNGALNHGQNNSYQPFVKNQFESLNFGRHPQENLYQAYMQKNMASNSTPPVAQPSLLPDHTIEAATKAITSDPNFQSALQAALSSIISSGGGGTSGIAGGSSIGKRDGGNLGQNSKLGDLFPVLSSFPSAAGSNANKYTVSSYLNKSSTTTTNSQPGSSLMFLPPNSSSPLMSTSKSKSASPDNSRLDQVK